MAETFNKDMNIIAQSDVEIQIDPITKDMNIIQKLDDEPNDVGGLTAAQLKAKFDEGGIALKNYINDSLIPQVLGAEATEATREANEAQRQANETARQTAETGRVQAENARVQAETGRQSAETARAAAETAREAAFAQDQADRAAAFTTAQNARETAFETTQTEQAAAFQTAQTQRGTAFAETQASRETAFTAAQQSQEARFQAAEEARDLWEDYDPNTEYVPGNKVYYQGSSYVNTAACQGVLPTVEANWQIVAKKGADGEGSFTQDQADQRYLQLSGGTMTGTLKLFGLPIDPEDAVPLTYVDGLIPETVVSSFKGRDGEVMPQSGDYTADMVGAYTKNQCISANTRTLLGLGSTATPDQALALLSKTVQYWWKKYPFSLGPTESSVSLGSFTQGNGVNQANVTVSIPYSSSINYSNGEFSLAAPIYTLNVTVNSAASVFNVLSGKYFTRGVSSNYPDVVDKTVYKYVGSPIKGTSTYSIYWNCNARKAILGDAVYVQSPNRSAYPDAGQSGNAYYEFIGNPIEDWPVPKSVFFTYKGTGTYGAASLSTLTFPFSPKFVIIGVSSGYMFNWYKDNDGMLYNCWAFWAPGTNHYPVFNGSTSSAQSKRENLYFVQNGNKLSYYAYDTAWAQLNLSNTTYNVIAFG